MIMKSSVRNDAEGNKTQQNLTKECRLSKALGLCEANNETIIP